MSPKHLIPLADDAETTGASAAALRALAAEHARFLAFLEPRVGARALAEEILQDAFVRSLERGHGLRDAESATAWFYRVLRNAIIDRARRRGAERKALEAVAHEPDEPPPSPDAATMNAVCGCVTALLDTLKPEYAAALRRVDLDGASVQELARESAITANHASVRLHRAREALRRQLARTCGACTTHGCLDCTCGEPAGGTG